MRRSKLILIFYFFCSQLQIFAQTFTDFSTKDGLSNNFINSIVKDDRGFLWIGTGEGLNRFDGRHFISFFSDHNNPASLSSNYILDLLCYKPGSLLIATDNGVSVLNTRTNLFETKKTTIGGLDRCTGAIVRSFFMDKHSGKIYINYSGEIDVFDSSLKFLYRLTDLPWAKDLKGVIINYEAWIMDKEGKIWMPSDNYGIIQLDEKNKKVYSYLNNPMQYPFFKRGPVRSFFLDEGKQFVCYSIWGFGLEKYDFKTKKLQTQYFNIANATESRCINAITENNGSLVCYGAQNIYITDPTTLRFSYFKNKEDFISCHTVLTDSENTWIGTETKGLIQLPSGASAIRQIKLPYTVHDFTNAALATCKASNGLIYMAYGLDGLLEVNEETTDVKQYKLPLLNGKPQTVFRICEDGKNRLLIGTRFGFYEFNKITKQFKKPDWLPSYTNNLSVSYMFRDSKGNICISFGSPNSIGYYDILKDKFAYFKNYFANNKPVFDSSLLITRMAEGDDGNIWMISNAGGGFLCFNPFQNQWKSFGHQKNFNSLKKKDATSICVTGQIVWLSNIYGGGLIRYDYTNDSLRYFTRKDGLLSENIFAISKNKEGKLFLVTKSGISYFDPISFNFSTLSINEESMDWSFASHQYYDSVQNELIYGLNDRIILLKSKLWQSGTTNLSTFINSIKINNTEYTADSANRIVLKYFQKNISIDFTTINYNKNLSPEYAYKMEGIDKEWNLQRQFSVANYSNLSPGSYIFLANAREQNGNWGEPAILNIRIVPAFWQTWWFASICIFIAGLCIYLVVKKRIKTIRDKAEMKHKIAETEMMALRSQMNPHFIFNCLNSIDSLIQNNEKEKATAYLSKFARLIRAILESTKANTIPCWKDIETLKLYLELEQLRWGKDFFYELIIDDKITTGDYKVPPMIIQPFVENAIQHGLLNKKNGDKKLTVAVAVKNDRIVYIVKDNGVGRKKAMEFKQLNRNTHHSMGIEITTERINLYNQNDKVPVKITDLYEGQQAAGTKVEIELLTH